MTCCSSLVFLLVVTAISCLQETSVDASLTEDIHSLQELDSHLTSLRLKRSIEGTSTGPCSTVGGILSIYPPFEPIPANTDSCLANGLAYTRCNPSTGNCECDPLVATRVKFLDNVTLCIPLAYVNESQGRCLPTLPDMCSVLVSGGQCIQTLAANPQPGVPNLRAFRCICQHGGIWPNCNPRLGSPCQNTTVCQFRLPNSYCANVNQSTGFGTCSCPRANQPLGLGGFVLPAGQVPQPLLPFSQTTVPNAQFTACVPLTCPPTPLAGAPAPAPGTAQQLDPCNEDNSVPNADTAECVNSPSGYQCTCRAGTKGRSHNITTPGRCCTADRIPCNDFSACLSLTNICDGTVQCNNCYDESLAFQCNNPWPSQCGPIPPGRSAVSSLMDNFNKLQVPNMFQTPQAVLSRGPPAPSAQAVSLADGQRQSASSNSFQSFDFPDGNPGSFGNFKIEAP